MNDIYIYPLRNSMLAAAHDLDCHRNQKQEHRVLSPVEFSDFDLSVVQWKALPLEVEYHLLTARKKSMKQLDEK